MTTRIRVRGLIAGALAAALVATSTAAQQAPAPESDARTETEAVRAREQALIEQRRVEQAAELERERARLEERRAETVELERAQEQLARRQAEQRAELERARADLEAAAREVARLAAATTAPVVADLTRRFAPGLPRATLGLVVENDGERVRVLNVTPNGPAAEAGVATGDLIVAVDGTPLADGEARTPSEALVERVGELEPGTRVRLALVRDGLERDVAVTTREAESPFVVRPFAGAERAEAGVRVALPDGSWRFTMPQFDVLRAFNAWHSMQLVALTADLGRYFGTEEGMLVVRAPERAGLGLRDGDVILEIGQRVPNSPEHATRILASFEPGETLRLTIMRDGRRETLELAVPEPAPR